ncbi:MAG TPA: hypothetical protein P5210_03725 [Draconibacterium sp.]|nr:hypothetical protein [Draconibacterium sp.]HRX10733.1 hypothetical protein [Draconibacterium sp.]
MNTNNFHYRVIKARVAETIIKELFLLSGYSVFDYGMERSMPSITGKLNMDNSETALQIRKMPDFVIQSPPPENELFYVEVKYRKNSQFPTDADDLINFPYSNAWFIIVSQNNIRCISYNQILQGKNIMADDCLLGNSEIFHLEKKNVKLFQEYARQFFLGVK